MKSENLLTEWEISEESRIQSIKSRIIAMQSQPERIDKQKIKLHIKIKKKLMSRDGSFQEFGGETALAKLSSIENLRITCEVIVHENETERTERLKKESEEGAQREREETC